MECQTKSTQFNKNKMFSRITQFICYNRRASTLNIFYYSRNYTVHSLVLFILYLGIGITFHCYLLFVFNTFLLFYLFTIK